MSHLGSLLFLDVASTAHCQELGIRFIQHLSQSYLSDVSWWVLFPGKGSLDLYTEPLYFPFPLPEST